jgi:multiple sugar transport system permease protein
MTTIALETAAADEFRKDTVRHKKAIVGFLAPFAILFAATYLVPIGYAVYQSFLKVERASVYSAPSQHFGGFEQYSRVFQSPEFWHSILRVLELAAVQMPVMLGLALFFRLAFFVPFAVPGVVAAIMWAFMYAPSLSPVPALAQHIDFLSQSTVLWSIGNVLTWTYTGVNMLIMYSALQAISPDLYEAARLDGSGQIRIAWSIKIPQIVPALIMTMVFSIIGLMQLFNEPTVFRTVSRGVSSTFTPNMLVYATSNVPNYNLSAAYSVVLALATGALSFAFLKAVQRRAF